MEFDPHQCRCLPPQISQFGDFWGEYPAVPGDNEGCGKFKLKGVPDDRGIQDRSGNSSYFSPGNRGH